MSILKSKPEIMDDLDYLLKDIESAKAKAKAAKAKAAEAAEAKAKADASEELCAKKFVSKFLACKNRRRPRQPSALKKLRAKHAKAVKAGQAMLDDAPPPKRLKTPPTKVRSYNKWHTRLNY